MPNETVSNYELNQLDKRLTREIAELRSRVDDNANNIAELNVKYNNLADLPSTINSLNNTLTVVSERLENMNTNINAMRETVEAQRKAVYGLKEENNHQNERMDEIDNKSKIDWAKAITNNFWKIIAVIGVLYAIFKDLI